jgi:hypothetical protein
VPGHHLQVGAAKTAGDRLSRFAKTNFVSGHGEGWALYAERLADELGWFTEPGTRLGMLGGSALRAARVVIDIGVHLDLPLPDGSRWTFDKSCEVLGRSGRGEPHRVQAEVVRYFGWPAQAISYKLGERGWLAARAEAMRWPAVWLAPCSAAPAAVHPVSSSAPSTQAQVRHWFMIALPPSGPLDAPPGRAVAACSGTDTGALGESFDAWCTEHIKPWVDDHVQMDEAIQRRWAGEGVDLSQPLPSDLILAAAEADPGIRAVAGGYLSTTELPASLRTAEPRARTLYAQRLASAPGPRPGPRRARRDRARRPARRGLTRRGTAD